MSFVLEEVRLNRARDMLTLVYADGEFALPAEFCVCIRQARKCVGMAWVRELCKRVSVLC